MPDVRAIGAPNDESAASAGFAEIASAGDSINGSRYACSVSDCGADGNEVDGNEGADDDDDAYSDTDDDDDDD